METDKEFSCDHCNFYTSFAGDWIRHCKSAKHLRKGEKKIHYCQECDYKTSSTTNLKIHTLSQHSTKEERAKQKYYCKDCDVFFISPLYLKSHMEGKKHANYVEAVKLMKELKEEK